MISLNKKFIFIHIPKCAGTSIEDLILDESCILNSNSWPHNLKVNYPLNHLTLDDIKGSNILYPNFNNFFSFTFVRNPFERLISEYFYLKPRLNLTEDIKKELIFLSSKSESGIFGNHCLSQSKFINDDINFVGKIEKLQQDFNIICDKIKVKKKNLARKNTTIHDHYSKYYDEECKDIVSERYKEDLENFNYKF